MTSLCLIDEAHELDIAHGPTSGTPRVSDSPERRPNAVSRCRVRGCTGNTKGNSDATPRSSETKSRSAVSSSTLDGWCSVTMPYPPGGRPRRSRVRAGFYRTTHELVGIDHDIANALYPIRRDTFGAKD